MKNATLKIEKKDNLITDNVLSIEHIIKHSTTKDEIVSGLYKTFETLCPLAVSNFNLKFGCGGSHVWGANVYNERLFIIELR